MSTSQFLIFMIYDIFCLWSLPF